MYTIMVSDSNELVTTVSERILRKSSLVDYLHFLVPPIYKNSINMRHFNVRLDYVLPISQDHFSMQLQLSKCLYKGMLEYRLPFDSKLTKEAGDVEIWLTFTRNEVDKYGQKRQICRRTSPTTIPIFACENNYDCDDEMFRPLATNKEVDDAFNQMVHKLGRRNNPKCKTEDDDDTDIEDLLGDVLLDEDTDLDDLDDWDDEDDHEAEPVNAVIEI